MSELFMRWQQLAWRLRLLILLCVWACGALLLRQGVVQPQWQQVQRLKASLEQQQGIYHRRQQTLLSHESSAELAPKIAALRSWLEATNIEVPFQLASLLAASGGTLEKWQPRPPGAELTLHLDWSQWQQLFSWLLVRQRPLQPAGLQIKPVNGRLSATLWLELDDET